MGPFASRGSSRRALSTLLCAAGLLLLPIACASPLPSAEPLGEGPLARAEAKEREKAEAEAEARAKNGPEGSDAGTPSSEPGATTESVAAAAPTVAPPESPSEVDAGSAAAGTDAGSSGAPLANYAGEYVGSDVSSYDMGGMKRDEKDDKARTRVDQPSSTRVSFTFIDSGTGKDICTLSASLAGKTATLTPGQKCWGSESESMSGTLTTGTAKFSDKRVVIDASFDLTVGSDEFKMTGKLDYHFDGTKK